MTLLALLVPALMMAFLFAMDALENLLFPRTTATDDVRRVHPVPSDRSPSSHPPLSST
ncbi:hypothetical protein [Streptomyces sp. YS415]|uniref:hypothetical protein n=1 Tax=Streptomyces sp. YS415 TaxID=2944806 RepID=UPI002021CE1A|nr:hypothetical protein [Streptomyces sp. YS415]MCL7429793.1 hypothetical protein [Streptomyces sp. YS415]